MDTAVAAAAVLDNDVIAEAVDVEVDDIDDAADVNADVDVDVDVSNNAYGLPNNILEAAAQQLSPPPPALSQHHSVALVPFPHGTTFTNPPWSKSSLLSDATHAVAHAELPHVLSVQPPR